jgi:hypothetical protein
MDNAVALGFRQRHGEVVPLAEPPTEARRQITGCLKYQDEGNFFVRKIAYYLRQ